VSTSVGSTTTFFVGGHYEVVVTDTGTQVNKYYFAGTQRIAMRKDTTLYYLLSDHLGSTSIVTDAAGTVISETRYKAWGEVRHQSGVTPTEYGFTGQYSHAADFGLMFYNARWYDVYLNHMTQPDTIVPDPYNSQDYDRYAYARNNPLLYTDPSGHEPKYGCYNSNGNTCLNANGNTIRRGRGQPIGNGDDLGLVFVAGSNYDGLDDDTRSFVIAANEEAYNMYDIYCQGLNQACEFSSAEELYTATHGTTVIEFSNSSLDKFCQRYEDGVLCGSNSRGKITPVIAAHELGHVFNEIIKSNGYPLDDPYHDLANERVNNPIFPALDADIAQGYKSNGGSPGEDFANMYSMWVFNSFPDTPGGAERKKFMSTNMQNWILQMLNP
jgi:RHS repeat-associated protein